MMFPCFLHAQNQGINFTTNSDWIAVLAQAKKENKYIFVDCNTTWCLPCQKMAKEVFTLKEVGDFMNEKFINVYLQIDSSKNDSGNQKSWYRDAANLKRIHSVMNYPTFLYFDQDGKLVHRNVGFLDPQAFLQQVRFAFDQNNQYVSLMDRVNSGNPSPEILLSAAMAAQNAYELKRAANLVTRYFNSASDKQLMDKNSIQFVKFYIESNQTTADPGFKFYQRNASKIDSIVGYPVASDLIKKMISQEISATVKESITINWNTIYKMMNAKYPMFADELVLKEKIGYFSNKKEWGNFIKHVELLKYAHGNALKSDEFNNYIFTLANGTNLKQHLQTALKWNSSEVLNKEDVFKSIIQATILYKIGKKNEAISWQKKAIKIAESPNKPALVEVLKIMQENKKIPVY